VGYLDELKRQADAARALQTRDAGALERNALVTESACQSAFRYLVTLTQQLNVLQPPCKSVLRLDGKTSFSDLRRTEFSIDSRRRKLRDGDVFDRIVLSFHMKTGTRLSLAKDFPPEIEKLEARLTQSGATYHSEVVLEPETRRFVEKRFDFVADFQGQVRLVPDHDSAWIDVQIVNIDGLETVTVRFPAFEIGPARLDELARWITGERHAFLRDGHELRRVAP
jgi:hypothetical protein